MANQILPQEKAVVKREIACRVMEQRQGWQLKRIEKTKDKILTASCVFHGNVSFQKSFEDS